MSSRKPSVSIADAIDRFSRMDAETKITFLIGLASELTILARDTYEAGGTGLTAPERMRSINEVQHRLLNFLSALVRSDANRYPDDVLIHIVLEHPDDADLQRQMAGAFSRTLSQTRIAA